MKVALVIGGADCVWLDLAELRALVGPKHWFECVIACNDVGGAYLGRIDHWVSLHPDKFPLWIGERKKSNLNMDMTFWTAPYEEMSAPVPIPCQRLSCLWGNYGSGSSGLFGYRVARELGYGKVALAGVPMTAAAGHYFGHGTWTERDAFAGVWDAHQREIREHCRSMSGWTRDLFGAPTKDWLLGA